MLNLEEILEEKFRG